MNRRRFLIASGNGLALTAAPSFLSCFFSRTRDPRIDSRTAVERARQDGKPLLVFVVPSQLGKSHERGIEFGRLLDHATDLALADLALCAVTCARLDALPLHARAPHGAADPLLLLFEKTEDGADPIAIDAELPGIESSRPDAGEDAAAHGKRVEESARRRLLALCDRIHAALAPDAATVARRARTAEAALPADLRERIGRFADSPADCPGELAERGAAILRQRAVEAGREDGAISALADVAISRLRSAPPEGAAWARQLGCELELDGVVESRSDGIECGQASVSPLAERFLYFFTQQR